MKDYEISRALAFAIGWSCVDVECTDNQVWVEVWSPLDRPWRVFDYRDPSVIWPIAERFNNFPYRAVNCKNNKVTWVSRRPSNYLVSSSDCPKKAVALAVIGAKP